MPDKLPQVNFPLFDSPSIPFQPVRDLRRSRPLYQDIDLSTARSIAAGTALFINMAGNTFYVDANPADGNASVHFQDTNLDNTSTPFYVTAGFIARIPYTQIAIENVAQAGKKIRIIYGVDLDFTPNTTSTVSATIAKGTTLENYGEAIIGTTASQLLVVETTRKQAVFYNSGTTNLYLGALGVTTANGAIMIAAGSTYIETEAPCAAWYAISDAAGGKIRVTGMY